MTRSLRNHLVAVLAALLCVASARAEPLDNAAFKKTIDKHCINCHDGIDKKGGLDLERLLDRDIALDTEAWEKVLRMIDARQMPPIGKRRPTDAVYDAASGHLSAALDANAAANPSAGRTDTFRRLSRTEYRNAIRDLLTLDIDAAALLPADEASHGFDHITVGDLPPALLTRYITAAQKISRLAIGATQKRPDGKTYRIKPDTTQEQHVPGLPLGTRGGGVFRHNFVRSGVYEIQIRLTRDRNDEVEGLTEPHELEVLIDNDRVAGFTVKPPPRGRAADFDDSKLRARIEVTAGPRDLGVTFIDKGRPVEQTLRQPLNVHFNLHRHPRLSPAIYEISITGPFLDKDSTAAHEPTPSRLAILGEDHEKTPAAAKKLLNRLARLAYRRPVTEADTNRLMRFFGEGHERGGFDAGIESALGAILTSPSFLFKIEREPKDAAPGEPYEISALELATRLSFFLWSSIPDDELLTLAERGKLREAGVLEAQVVRMLADDKASSLVTNFASQWLHLRNLDSITPDARLFPDFDDNLRLAMRTETQMHVRNLIENDRSVLDLITANHTYLNERLAKHYGIAHVYGSRFRRIDLPADSERGGLLRQASILTVTSYATRTSPVIRGNWVLENIIGAPAPPPPDDVPALEETEAAAMDVKQTVRERLAKHRKDPACASCHNLMDPVGFSLEQYDAVGRWRTREAGRPIDAAGGLPDGSEFVGVAGLEAAILKRPKLFVTAMTERLMTFALGRGVGLNDGPAVRRIVKRASEDDYRFSSIAIAIVRSTPFQMRDAP